MDYNEKLLLRQAFYKHTTFSVTQTTVTISHSTPLSIKNDDITLEDKSNTK